MSSAEEYSHANCGCGPVHGPPCYMYGPPPPNLAHFSFGLSAQMPGVHFVQPMVQGQAFSVPVHGVPVYSHSYVAMAQPAAYVGSCYVGSAADGDAFMRQVPYAQYMSATSQALGLTHPNSDMHTVSVPPGGGAWGGGGYLPNVPGGYWPGPQQPNKAPMDGGRGVWSPHAPMPVDRYYAQGGRGSA